MTKYWKDQPWATKPEILLDQLNRTYQRALELGKIQGPEFVTLKKVMAFRRWFAAVPREQLLQAIRDLELIYVPKDMEPGPGFLFQIRDVTGEVRRAHIRLMDSNDYGDLRYLSLVDKTKFIGPAWVGADDEALASIIAAGEVLLVEGPFDLLAIRTIMPEVPSLCSTTKRLGDGHWDYLKILGVEKIHVMFDIEASGRGEQAMDVMKERAHGFIINPVKCPAHDPAEALKTPHHIEALRNTLRGLIPRSTATTTLVLEDDE